MRPPVAVLLARVSSREQAEGYSLDAQLGLLREYAKRAGLVVRAEHRIVESASGKRERVQFNAILAACSTVQHLVVEKVDRLTRNQRDVVAVDDLRLAGLRVHLVKEGIVLSPASTSQQLLVWDMHAMMARHYLRNLSEETKKGMAEKQRQGGWTHLAPLGLLNLDRRLEHDPERAPLVRQLVRAILDDGLTLPQAVAHAEGIGLRSRTGRKLSRADLHRLLHSPLIAGLLPDGNRASVEPIVGADDWRAVVALLESRSRGRGPRAVVEERPHRFAGLMSCADCGRAIVAELHRGRHGRGRYVYYRCASGSKSACGRAYVREERLAEQIAARLDRLTFPEEELPRLRESLAAASKAEAADQSVARRTARAAEERARRRAQAAVLAHVDGSISADELAAVRLQAEADAATARRTLDRLAAADEAWSLDVVRALALLRDAGRLFLKGTAAEQRSLVVQLLHEPRLRAGQLVAGIAEPFVSIDGVGRLKRASADSEGLAADSVTGSAPETLHETLRRSVAAWAGHPAVARLLAAA